MPSCASWWVDHVLQGLRWRRRVSVSPGHYHYDLSDWIFQVRHGLTVRLTELLLHSRVDYQLHCYTSCCSQVSDHWKASLQWTSDHCWYPCCSAHSKQKVFDIVTVFLKLCSAKSHTQGSLNKILSNGTLSLQCLSCHNFRQLHKLLHYSFIRYSILLYENWIISQGRQLCVHS